MCVCVCVCVCACVRACVCACLFSEMVDMLIVQNYSNISEIAKETAKNQKSSGRSLTESIHVIRFPKFLCCVRKRNIITNFPDSNEFNIRSPYSGRCDRM